MKIMANRKLKSGADAGGKGKGEIVTLMMMCEREDGSGGWLVQKWWIWFGNFALSPLFSYSLTP